MNFVSITFQNIKKEIDNYLKTEHSKGNVLFSPASPYGQILSVIEKLHQLSFLYLKNTISQLDIVEPGSLNERVIKNTAILAGHIPGRAISATGTLKLSLKSNIDFEKEIPGGRITIANRTLIKNNTNGLDYSFNLGTDTITHKITPSYQFFLPLIQGSWVVSNKTGLNQMLQTLSFTEPGMKQIENFNYEVIVQGEYWSVKKHIYEQEMIGK